MNRRHLLFLTIFPVMVIISQILMTSCYHEPNFISELDTVCYDSTIAPILQASCALSGCHNSTTKSEGLDATSYQSVRSFVKPGNAKESLLYESITRVYQKGLMPPDVPPHTGRKEFNFSVD
ncbi:MAG: hypothetical protein IPM71_00340 [Bacteroidota bacterium]|nr:MAG: hypothetical protein IPM71_00340 [Bacteroidota bacterium]